MTVAVDQPTRPAPRYVGGSRIACERGGHRPKGHSNWRSDDDGLT